MARASYRKDNEHFRYTNANPKNSKSSGDCVVRAISLATGLPWDKVYTELCNIGFKLKSMPNDDKTYEKYLESMGWEKQRQPRKHDNTKYLAKELAEMSSQGNGITAIIRVANHLSVVSNGFILDTWDCGYKTVGNFWIYKGGQ